MGLACLLENLGRAAPDHHRPGGPAAFLKLPDVVNQRFGQLFLVGLLFDVGTVDARDEALLEYGRPRPLILGKVEVGR